MTSPITKKMTNPFAIITLHAIDSYHRALTSITYPQNTLPKVLLYTVGTSLLATVIYNSMKKTNMTSGTPSPPSPPPPPPKPIPYNFLYKISLPFKNLLYKIQGNTSPPTLTQQTTTPIQFEDKYFKEYDEWASSTQQPETNEVHKKECLENMYYSTVRETINEFYGDVIMCYDHTTLSFAYYARTGSIPYKYLETISRKYMIDTNAPKEIHVDIRSEYNKAKECKQATATNPADHDHGHEHEHDHEHDHDHEHEHDHEDTVFVKLKSYNNVSNLKIHTNTNDKTTTEKKDTFVRPESKAHPNMILRENANRYSYRGKITDFEEHHKLFLVERRTPTHPPTLTSTLTPTLTPTPTTTKYAEFKKQMMKSAL